MTLTEAGTMWAIGNIAGLPASFVIPLLAQKLENQRPLLITMILLWGSGMIGMVVSPATATLIWMVLFGLGAGSALSLALMLIVLRSPDTPHAAALSGMAQAIGYTLASFAPFLGGLAHDLSGNWSATSLAMLSALIPTALIGWRASRRGLVRSSIEVAL